MALDPRELLSSKNVAARPRISPHRDGVALRKFAPVVGAPELPVCTPVAYETVLNAYVFWQSGGANGRGTIIGFIFDPVQTHAANDVQGQVMHQGLVHFKDVLAAIKAVDPAQTEANLKTALCSGPLARGLIVQGLTQVR